MNLIPIQVTDEGVLIHKSYLHQANAVEVIMHDEYFLVKPKQVNGKVVESYDLTRHAHFTAALDEIRRANAEPPNQPTLIDQEIIALVKSARKKRAKVANNAHRS